MREWKYRHETARKGRGWKMQEWKDRHDSAGGGKCRSKMRVETLCNTVNIAHNRIFSEQLYTNQS